jgi:hypothetical protein
VRLLLAEGAQHDQRLARRGSGVTLRPTFIQRERNAGFELIRGRIAEQPCPIWPSFLAPAIFVVLPVIAFSLADHSQTCDQLRVILI